MAGHVNTRIELTNSFVEDGLYAWKKQLYDALMGYADQQIYAQVPSIPTMTPELIEDAGFNVVESVGSGSTKTQVKGPKKALYLEGFTSAREGESRINNPEVAASMAQVMQVMMANPMTMMAIGPQQAIDIYNMIIRIAGLPREFKLHVQNQQLVNRVLTNQAGPDPAQQQQQGEQMQQMFAQLAEQILQRSGEQAVQVVQEAVTPLVEEHKKVAEAIGQITEVVKRVPPLEQGVQELATRLQQLIVAASAGAPE